MRILLTGTAGFIGFHVAKPLLERGDEVIGLDNLNDYYDVSLKQARLNQLSNDLTDHPAPATPHASPLTADSSPLTHHSSPPTADATPLTHREPRFAFHKLDLADRPGMETLFADTKPQRVIHLAAQAGVRYSLENPHAYIDSNLVGFMNILEGCRHHDVEHLVYASSSSVYGANTKMPFSVHDNVDHPLSLYAASKKANELMAHTYSHLYRLPTTGLRFFTVYGPWGRPDMAIFLFTKAILEGRPINVFNHGQMRRDFTYIDDIVEGIIRVTDRLPEPNLAWSGEHPDPGDSKAPYRVYNIGNNQPVELMHLIATLEKALGKQATMKMLPIQPGDVPATYADVDDLMRDVDFKPSTPIEEGVRRFVDWYSEFYGV